MTWNRNQSPGNGNWLHSKQVQLNVAIERVFFFFLGQHEHMQSIVVEFRSICVRAHSHTYKILLCAPWTNEFTYGVCVEWPNQMQYTLWRQAVSRIVERRHKIFLRKEQNYTHFTFNSDILFFFCAHTNTVGRFYDLMRIHLWLLWVIMVQQQRSHSEFHSFVSTFIVDRSISELWACLPLWLDRL